jgi:tRNA(Ile)-lysidine synthase
VSTAETIVSAAEAASLFENLTSFPALLLAVSGGPDSTALMVLAARWRKARKKGPVLIAVTVDHGLRTASAAEARAVAKLARQLGIQHRTLRWTGAKPKTGLPQAARTARYRLLAAAARQAGAPAVLTAHTLDDQAETVLIRMSRGSGLTGLAGMQSVSVVPGRPPGARARNDEILLVRPFLTVPKTRLIATLAAAKVPFTDDPTNRDPRFTRARLRGLMPVLAAEGMHAARLALMARRLARADEALTAVAEADFRRLAVKAGGSVALAFDRTGFLALSAEIAQRILARAIDAVGDEGPVELGKLEVLCAALGAAAADPEARFRRSLAGALVSLTPQAVAVERAPARRSRSLTTRERSPRVGAKSR